MLIPRCSTSLAAIRHVLLVALTFPLAATPRAAAAGSHAALANAALEVDGAAALREWHPPKYPAEALKDKASGMVNVRLVVDETGRVTQARALEDSDEAFVESALAAVKSWTFAPALNRGKPVASCLDTLVTFSPAAGQQAPTRGNLPPESQTFQPAPRTPPKPTVTPEGGYPDVLRERYLGGVVEFTCVVSTEGRAIDSKIISASHADFVLPAIEALRHWEFSPGAEGDLPSIAPVDGRMTFDSIGTKGADVYRANGITARDGSAPAVVPDLLRVADPVWPLDRLLAGEEGSAVVEFTVGESGLVRDVHVLEATHADFGEALTAAVQTWIFDRPVENHQVTAITLMKRQNFPVVPADATADPSLPARLVVALRKGEVGGAKGLDEKLTPVYQVAPVYPQSIVGERPKGRAEIEFIIDREGRARLPRILTATQPEFGWAAATAVAQWVFKAPHRGGEPTDVKVKIPFEFTPPEI